MKVVIIGGYGAFGARTARLLARDGHTIWLAGRNPDKGAELAREIGAQTLYVDRLAGLERLFDVEPDVVIDAAGPFQDYGDDPYHLQRRCIETGCHCLDLSDSSTFTNGISALDEAAKAAGVYVLSGASSVPGLSSIIVNDLSADLREIAEIDIAILPGNRAPRGMSVIKSVVASVGRPTKVHLQGSWQIRRGWAKRKVYELESGMHRAGYLVDVPDLSILPEVTGAKSVMFRAGFELPIMNAGLSLLAALRRFWRLELPEIAYDALLSVSRLLLPFGTDRGGMQITVSGQKGDDAVSRRWTLIAEEGDGPFVPGIVCRALLLGPAPRPGARPCLAEVSRQRVETAMADLAIRFRCDHPAVSESESLTSRWSTPAARVAARSCCQSALCRPQGTDVPPLLGFAVSYSAKRPPRRRL